MSSRTPSQNPSASPGESEYMFHLVGKKAVMGTPGSIVGAIVSGPVAGFIGGAVGTAFQTMDESGPAVNQLPNANGSGAKKALKKPGTKRRRQS